MKPNKCWNTSVKEEPGNGFSDGSNGPREESKYSKACTRYQVFVETLAEGSQPTFEKEFFPRSLVKVFTKFHKLTYLLNGRGETQTLIIRVHNMGEKSMTSQPSRKVKLMDEGNLAPSLFQTGCLFSVLLWVVNSYFYYLENNWVAKFLWPLCITIFRSLPVSKHQDLCFSIESLYWE